MDKPELVSFSRVSLRPSWFINVSSEKFRFINTTWINDVHEELRKADQRYRKNSHRVLASTYRDLAINSEDAHRYREASDFRYASMDVMRLEERHGNAFWKLLWWYWLASGYGERIGGACVFLCAIWFLFAVAYMKVAFAVPRMAATPEQIAASISEYEEPLKAKRAFIYSLGVVSLQRPEPKPITNAALLLVSMESLLGPLQAALLVLAIRRKFMR